MKVTSWGEGKNACDFPIYNTYNTSRLLKFYTIFYFMKLIIIYFNIYVIFLSVKLRI